MITIKSLSWSAISSSVTLQELKNFRKISGPFLPRTKPPRTSVEYKILELDLDHDVIRVWKSETGMDWQIGWVGKAVRILIHRWLVLWVQFPVEATLFLLIWKPLDVNFIQMSDLCYLGKTRLSGNPAPVLQWVSVRIFLLHFDLFKWISNV